MRELREIDCVGESFEADKVFFETLRVVGESREEKTAGCQVILDFSVLADI